MNLAEKVVVSVQSGDREYEHDLNLNDSDAILGMSKRPPKPATRLNEIREELHSKEQSKRETLPSMRNKVAPGQGDLFNKKSRIITPENS